MSATATTTHTHTSALGENTRVGYVRRTGEPYIFERDPRKHYGHRLKPLKQRLSPAQIERRQLKREDRATFRATVGRYLALLVINQNQRAEQASTLYRRFRFLFLGR